MIRICFIGWLFFFVSRCLAQDLPPITQQQLEDVAESNDEEPKDDHLLQQLEYYRKHPINLNTATVEELQSLRLLNDLQVNNLIRYRSLLGNLISIFELQSIPGWSLVTINRVLPYIAVSNPQSSKQSFLSRFHNGDISLLFRISRVLEKSKGYDTSLNSHYLGDRNHLAFRYRYQYKDLLYFGITADKDAGEQFFRGAQSKGFDFYSFHFFARRVGWVKSLAIGDYTVNFGQGLIQWQGLAFGKSAEAVSIKRQAPALSPYRSAGEFYFNRGVAVTIQKGRLQSTLFGSYKKISGNIISDTTEWFSSLGTSGYYRTPLEIADRNRINLTSFGGNIAYQSTSLKLGFNAVAHRFNIPLQKRNEPYNLYSISGRNIFNSSLDYSYTYKNLHFFGETAVDKNLHSATVDGVLISVDPKVDLSFLYRNIQAQYQTLFGNAATENSTTVNEKGFYSGLLIRPATGWQLNAYADFYRFPWIKYLVNAPSNGHEYLVQLNYQPDKLFAMYLRFRNKDKPTDISGTDAIYHPLDQVKQNLRVHLSRQLANRFSMNTRLELLWLNPGAGNEERGFLSYVEANYASRRLSAGLRFQYFETNSYNSRIYVYESDVLYSYSIPAFYDKGVRYYFNVHYKFTRDFVCYFRLAQTVFTNKELIGSGLDEITGNKKTEIKLQLSYLF
ncbi:MAG: ComEA family DNA-binding protein [Flavisolibacter sp.]